MKPEPMTSSPETRSPRLLFILNNDYGELGLAMYFLQGRNLASTTTLLLPPRLYSKNKDTLPGKTYSYDSIDDILCTVDETEPDIVFLFSGYILPLHQIISLEETEALVQLLSDRNCKVVTSDPFFGIFSQLDPAEANAPEALQLFETEIIKDQPWPYRLSTTFGNMRILKQFARASHIIRNTTHLYYTRTHPDDEPIEVGTDNVTFFNPSLVRDGDTSADTTSGNAASESADDRHWLFILGSVDYDLQTSFYGEERFIDILQKKLEQTLQAGRRPVFLAPDECVQKLRSRAPVHARKDLLTFCAYEDFNARLLNAEYVFYWNLASYSTFLRVINGLPMFMFDEGHLARHVKPMHERMVRWYYQNWTPPSLNQHEALDADALEDLASTYKKETDVIVKNLRELPPPEQVIQELFSR
ncbi:Uncharacterised protein [Halioglobus japonicus]|nr:Uncharacterised protein [Halioglobus japonicus]